MDSCRGGGGIRPGSARNRSARGPDSSRGWVRPPLPSTRGKSTAVCPSMLPARAGVLRAARVLRAHPTPAPTPAPACTRLLSASAARANVPAGGAPDPKLVAIVDQVEKLTLLEASSLVTLLKVRSLPCFCSSVFFCFWFCSPLCLGSRSGLH